ncbi:hypothetical protein [Leptospira meyeri]|uniref:hypothetical protein n=1 Tax=Leptospira meyeri TaxID=29508 RepID=UPI001083F809|nr:hypothetical protein [Leptospira meyeri]TGL16876.1 hypothetical protein EHQ50_00030 [Leptospira meyeri]
MSSKSFQFATSVQLSEHFVQDYSFGEAQRYSLQSFLWKGFPLLSLAQGFGFLKNSLLEKKIKEGLKADYQLFNA